MTEIEQKHQNVNLLFFLNAVMGSVANSLKGEFQKTAKYKFNKVINSTNQLEKELLSQCERSAHETYNKASVGISKLLNKAIEAYNENKLEDFINHCEKF